MALTSKKYERIFSETGSDGDLITADEKALMKKEFDENTYIEDKDAVIRLGPVLWQLQKITEELDYLRTEISNNKDKTGISNSQANAITANTAKTGITTQQATAITDNVNEAKRLDGLIATNTTNITANTRSIGINNLAAINVGSYPLLPPTAPAGTTQSHGSEIVYDVRQKKYFLNIYYTEDSSRAGGKRIIRTGQIELK